MTEHLIDIIIPTYNNPEMVKSCITSMLVNRATVGLFKIILINNGHKDSLQEIEKAGHVDVRVIQSGENLGWEGGLKKGLEVSKTPFVVFANDDIYVPRSSYLWANMLLSHFVHPDCAASGPASNFVAGFQNMNFNFEAPYFSTPFLIGFCVMIRRSHLDEVGGVDDSLPYHGDDIDLSIRFKKAGKFLVCDKRAFVYHYGCQTGNREFGSYWNSTSMLEKTYHSLFRKHGVRAVYETFLMPKIEKLSLSSYSKEDLEGNIIRSYVSGNNILELACGGQKTVPNSVGLDIIPFGELIPGLQHTTSAADMVGDVQNELPFPGASFDTVIGRHILEHMIDPIEALSHWGSIIKEGGRLILALPNDQFGDTIPMNFQHRHAYTPASMKNLMKILGWKIESIQDSGNGVSFIGVFSKNGVHA